MTAKAIMFSIRPIYAKKIFDGTKKVELRRIKPNINKGDIVVVYVSAPIKQIWGILEVEKIIEKSVNELWLMVHQDAGLSKDEFINYYCGKEHGCGIYLKKSPNSIQPISLKKFQEYWKNFTPPQSYRYLTSNELNTVFMYLNN